MKQITQCLENVRQNRTGLYNSQIMLSIMFGNNYKEKYVKALANSTFQRGILLENIGKQLKMDAEHKYVHELKGICKGNLEEDIDVRHIFALLD